MNCADLYLLLFHSIPQPGLGSDPLRFLPADPWPLVGPSLPGREIACCYTPLPTAAPTLKPIKKQKRTSLGPAKTIILTMGHYNNDRQIKA
ncbi:hypothetical protein PoB_002551400 [Plakobranchus ocellatus]|uniref:Uncharacterized protein n=1 Tax=Plakobranchus ocellatus TaxID=259542 RepID=A0AAV3ZYK7_9GAST|nr:hypothetical protein PoB_002551400 [Plakobranchus ocellatus]